MSNRRALLLLPLAFLAAACAKPSERAGAEDTAAQSTEPPAAETSLGGVRLASTSGFKTPESVRYDDANDVFYVSNINGSPTGKDNNGFISRMHPDGTLDTAWTITSGRNGVTLHAPKGMALQGDTLWVTDIDAVRSFLVSTGAPIATVDFAGMGATFLNDVVIGPDGLIYITDSAVGFKSDGSTTHPSTDKIFRIGANRRTGALVVSNDAFNRPNGITWDPGASRFVIVSFGGNTVLGWSPTGGAPTVLARASGTLDGVERLEDGRFLVSAWADSSIYAVDGEQVTRVLGGLPSPADIGIDRTRGRVAVPLFTQDRVEIWQIPPR